MQLGNRICIFPLDFPRCLFLVRFSFVRASSALFLPFSRLRARLISRPYYQPREEAAPVRFSSDIANRGLAKYTRCVSVAARGVASSLPAGRFNCRPGASFEVNVIRLFRSLSRTYVTGTSPFLPFLRGILYRPFPYLFLSPSQPLPLSLAAAVLPVALFLSLSFSSFVFILSFGALVRVSDERTLRRAHSRAPRLANTRPLRTLSSRNSDVKKLAIQQTKDRF